MPFLLAINICMKTFVCASLVDITETGVIRGESIERDQQRNWQSILQVLSLPTQPHIIIPPKIMEHEELEQYKFGEFYRGRHNMWAFKFTELDHAGHYTLDLLENACDEVPMILGLNETARMMLPVFHTHGTLKNIYFVEQR